MRPVHDIADGDDLMKTFDLDQQNLLHRLMKTITAKITGELK